MVITVAILLLDRAALSAYI